VFIARHLPSARHLRFVSGVLRIITMLERVGDYAETISRASLQLSQPPTDAIAKDLETMSRHVLKNLELSLRAFQEEDADLARATRTTAKQYLPTFDQIFNDLVKEGEKGIRPIAELFSLLAIFNRLERVLHHCKNICEQTLFAVAGEEKQAKKFDILFMDEQNAGASQLAEFYAQKAYPEGGTFRSASWSTEEVPLDPKFEAYAQEKGIDLSDASCMSFKEVSDRIQDFDILIDLSGSARSHINKIPFHTTLLTWKLDDPDDPEAVYKQLVPHLHELIACILGEEEDS